MDDLLNVIFRPLDPLQRNELCDDTINDLITYGVAFALEDKLETTYFNNVKGTNKEPSRSDRVWRAWASVRGGKHMLSLIHISEPTRLALI
eukprot:12480205-Alexandrium_andersonii.AAC.1